jgi:hypothetical protein
MALLLLGLAQTASAATFTVTNLGGGTAVGSLGWAITQVNSSTGANTITFALPGTIMLTGPLPSIDQKVSINPASPTLPAQSITIDGINAGSTPGLVLGPGSGGSIINDIAVTDFAHGAGIVLNSNGNQITNSTSGTDASRSVAWANATGVSVTSSGNQLVGDTFSGNTGDGIDIGGSAATGNTIAGSTIGLGAGGKALGNGGFGIVASSGAQNNTIGGTAPTQANVISSNSMGGVYVTGMFATNNHIWGNLIGTDPSGGSLAANGATAVTFNNGAQFNSIAGGWIGYGTTGNAINFGGANWLTGAIGVWGGPMDPFVGAQGGAFFAAGTATQTGSTFSIPYSGSATANGTYMANLAYVQCTNAIMKATPSGLPPQSGVIGSSGTISGTFTNATQPHGFIEGGGQSGFDAKDPCPLASGGGGTTPTTCDCLGIKAFLNHFHIFGAGSTRIEFDLNWQLTCSAGEGNCKGRVVVYAPKGATFLNLNGKTLRPAQPTSVSVSCAGPCNKSTTGKSTLQYVAFVKVSDRKTRRVHNVPNPHFLPQNRAGKTFKLKLGLVCLLPDGQVGTLTFVDLELKFDKHGQVNYKTSDLNGVGGPDGGQLTGF